jgi:RNA polymerase sigma-70 factor (sigma-E family)
MLGRLAVDTAPSDHGSSRLAQLYGQSAGGAVRLAYLLTGDAHLAEDLVQEAFLRVVGRLVHIRDSNAFDAYLKRVVVNLANSHFRRRRVERAYLRRHPHSESARDSEQAIERHDLLRALSRLPARQRAALALRFYEDLPEKEIADILKCAHGTVRSLISRGVATLRKEMGDEW